MAHRRRPTLEGFGAPATLEAPVGTRRLGPLELLVGEPRPRARLLTRRGAATRAGSGDVAQEVERWFGLRRGTRWVLGLLILGGAEGGAGREGPEARREGARGGPAATGVARGERGTRDGAEDGAKRAPVGAAALANAFARIAARDDRTLDNPTLQGLCVQAHAWHLVERGGGLLGEPVVAMPWGPAIRSLMRDRTLPIATATPVTRLVFDPGADVPLAIETPEVGDPDTLRFLEDVYEALRGMDGVALTRAGCGAREPWSFVRSFHGDLGTGPAIPDALIETCFRTKRSEAATTAGRPGDEGSTGGRGKL